MPTTRPLTLQNLRALRNCTLINSLDGCAISLPAHRLGEVPVGLMLAAVGGSDRRIFELAAGMESVTEVHLHRHHQTGAAVQLTLEINEAVIARQATQN